MNEAIGDNIQLSAALYLMAYLHLSRTRKLPMDDMSHGWEGCSSTTTNLNTVYLDPAPVNAGTLFGAILLTSCDFAVHRDKLVVCYVLRAEDWRHELAVCAERVKEEEKYLYN